MEKRTTAYDHILVFVIKVSAATDAVDAVVAATASAAVATTLAIFC